MTFSSAASVWTEYCSAANCFGHSVWKILRELNFVVQGSQYIILLACLLLWPVKIYEGINFSYRSTNHENSVEVFDWHSEAVNLESIKIEWKLLQLGSDCVLSWKFLMLHFRFLYIFMLSHGHIREFLWFVAFKYLMFNTISVQILLFCNRCFYIDWRELLHM